MIRPGFAGSRSLLGLVAGLALVGATGVEQLSAQSGGSGFLFGAPRAAFTLKGGFNQPRAASGNGGQSLWDLTREQFTVGNSDLAGVSITAELAVRANERFDVTFAFGYALTEPHSEYRDWVGDDDLPIEQVTSFSTKPMTIGFKAYLRDRGRSVGSLAWIPRTWNPYVGVAGGVVSYRFEQYGEFIDYETYDIFEDNLLSEGRAPTIHLIGGMDFSINRHLLLVGEARYGLASAPLDSDFVGFSDLDLAGFQVTGGITLRF